MLIAFLRLSDEQGFSRCGLLPSLCRRLVFLLSIINTYGEAVRLRVCPHRLLSHALNGKRMRKGTGWPELNQ